VYECLRFQVAVATTPKGKLHTSGRNVKVKGHADNVLEKVKELSGGEG